MKKCVKFGSIAVYSRMNLFRYTKATSPRVALKSICKDYYNCPKQMFSQVRGALSAMSLPIMEGGENFRISLPISYELSMLWLDALQQNTATPPSIKSKEQGRVKLLQI